MSSNAIICIIGQHVVNALRAGVQSCHAVAEPSISAIDVDAAVYQ